MVRRPVWAGGPCGQEAHVWAGRVGGTAVALEHAGLGYGRRTWAGSMSLVDGFCTHGLFLDVSTLMTGLRKGRGWGVVGQVAGLRPFPTGAAAWAVLAEVV